MSARSSGGFFPVVVALGVAGALLRALAVPEVVGDVDSVNFARALGGFDPTVQAPHFPGYPVFVGAAALIRALGVASDAWALALPAIVSWPLAAVVLGGGLRRVLPVCAAVGAVAAASVAPGAVVAGGWPASDGFGLSLGALAVGGACIAATTQTRPRVATTLSAAAVFALLGVRLSWWPMCLAVAALMLRAHPRRWAWLLVGAVLGTALWTVPMVLAVGGVQESLELATGFVGGHVGQWGGTVVSSDAALGERLLAVVWGTWHVMLGAMWPTSSAASPVWNEALVGFVMLVAAAGLAAGRPLPRWIGVGMLAVLPYLFWVVVFQNVDRPRHLLPLVPWLGALSGWGLARWRASVSGQLRWATVAAVTVVMGAVSAPRAWEQGHRDVAAVALTRELLRHPLQRRQLFAGSEARVIEHHAPMVRVLRPANATVLVAEARRLASAGVEVWVSSGAPGVEALRGDLTLLARFSHDGSVRPHQTSFDLFRFDGPTFVATTEEVP